MGDEKPADPKNEAKNALIDTNVALVLAENAKFKEDIAAKDVLIVDLTKQLKQATDLIEQDTKSRLVFEIAPKTTVSKELLGRMSIDELSHIKETLDRAVVPAFNSGTPLVGIAEKKPSLDGMFTEYMGKLGGNKK